MNAWKFRFYFLFGEIAPKGTELCFRTEIPLIWLGLHYVSRDLGLPRQIKSRLTSFYFVSPKFPFSGIDLSTSNLVHVQNDLAISRLCLRWLYARAGGKTETYAGRISALLLNHHNRTDVSKWRDRQTGEPGLDLREGKLGSRPGPPRLGGPPQKQ